MISDYYEIAKDTEYGMKLILKDGVSENDVLNWVEAFWKDLPFMIKVNMIVQLEGIMDTDIDGFIRALNLPGDEKELAINRMNGIRYAMLQNKTKKDTN